MSSERKETIGNFFRVYMQMQKKYGLRMHARTDERGTHMEIWEYKDGKKTRNVCWVRGEEEECYKKAVESLERMEK